MPKFVFDIRGIMVKRPKNQINANYVDLTAFLRMMNLSIIKFLEFVLHFGKCFGLAMNHGRSETLLLGNSLFLPLDLNHAWILLL